jgi:hypothetical protein
LLTVKACINIIKSDRVPVFLILTLEGGDMMAKKKTKSASKKVEGAKSKSKTNSDVSVKPNRTKASETATAKKAVKKKASAAIADSKKTKASAVNKAKPATKAKTSAKKAATMTKPPSAANKKASKTTPEERYRMVQTAAYFIAEQHGFQGRSDEHWAAAERAIAIKLGQ